MPETRMPGSRHATKEGMHAEVMPMGRGSVGIIGAELAVVESVAGALKG
jgi:hypothetical protein